MNTTTTHPLTHSFSLRSLRPLAKGEELLISYGADKPNCEAVRDYGFVLAGNSHDRIQFGATAAAAAFTSKAAAACDGAAGGAEAPLPGLNEACLMEVRSVSRCIHESNLLG